MDYSGPAYAKAHADECRAYRARRRKRFRRAQDLYAPRAAGAAKTPFIRTLADTMTPLGIFLSPAPALDSGDDIAPLHAAGVPVIAFRQNGLDYFDIHHTADDTLDKVDPQELAQNIAAWAAMTYLAAQSDLDFRKLSNRCPTLSIRLSAPTTSAVLSVPRPSSKHAPRIDAGKIDAAKLRAAEDAAIRAAVAKQEAIGLPGRHRWRVPPRHLFRQLHHRRHRRRQRRADRRARLEEIRHAWPSHGAAHSRASSAASSGAPMQMRRISRC